MTKSVVIDASFSFRLLTPNPLQAACREQMSLWQKQGIMLAAPALWANEITSALTKAVHFGQLSRQNAEIMLELAFALPIQLLLPDAQKATRAFEWTFRLQRAAAYDSFYLALANELDCELWTADKKLVKSIGESWVRYIG